MRNIYYKTTLVYYDGPQVIEGRDAIGGNYIGVLADHTEQGSEKFLLAGVAPERLRLFRIGSIDLLSLLVERSEDEWFLGQAGATMEEPIKAAPLESRIEESGFLPAPGFVMRVVPASNELIKEARERNKLIMEIVVEPPEATDCHRIHLTTLARLLSEIQLLAKHAYKRALREVPPSIRRTLSPDSNAQFDVVVPASPGSFRVLLEASTPPDLVGQNELSRALAGIDIIFESVAEPSKNLETVRRYKGHLAGAYIRLLGLLAENDTSLAYSWAEPNTVSICSHHVAHLQAATLVNLFSQETNLEREDVEFVGVLRKADMTNRTWRLETESGLISGRVAKGGPTLGGLVTENTYKFYCVEKLIITERGTEERTYHLVEHTELDEHVPVK